MAGCGAIPSKLSESPPPIRRVSFGSVDIQEHDLTLGDHPDVSNGPPISLDWKVKRRNSFDVESYEKERQISRRPSQGLIIPFFERRKLLKEVGYTDAELRKAASDVIQTKM
mmetsp:Transcript_21760/g.44047  ORF Transcript_21760/g.44047 Transcript_21760/m.44047 type:complete len:112 (-) Transcript_21760:160-495(-)